MDRPSKFFSIIMLMTLLGGCLPKQTEEHHLFLKRGVTGL